MEKKQYKKPVFAKVKGLKFILNTVNKNNLVCRQCSGCHGCR